MRRWFELRRLTRGLRGDVQRTPYRLIAHGLQQRGIVFRLNLSLVPFQLVGGHIGLEGCGLRCHLQAAVSCLRNKEPRWPEDGQEK